MQNETLYQLALTLVPQIGDVQAKLLVQQLGSAGAVFQASVFSLEKIEGIGTIRARAIKAFRDFDAAEAELKFIEKQAVTPLFLTDAAYPRRLLHCYDAPSLLFYKGTADLNASKIVAIVGTRTNTDYGKTFTEKLVHDLAAQHIVIVSGLAYGIDAFAHKAALKNGLPTVGVVGHGLDKVYPAAHTGLAQEMINAGGGLLTEFFSGTKPDKHNFPLRNRVVAGIADATVVVETLVSGGSMITAKLADAYNRDVFAVPGRTIDTRSAGCNYLIRHNKAILLTEASQLLDVMGWAETKKEKKPQRMLFIEMTDDERKIVDLLQQQETTHLDDINITSGLSSSAVAAAVLNLELQNIVASLPGKLLKLL